jgi:hypothetical protein
MSAAPAGTLSGDPGDGPRVEMYGEARDLSHFTQIGTQINQPSLLAEALVESNRIKAPSYLRRAERVDLPRRQVRSGRTCVARMEQDKAVGALERMDPKEAGLPLLPRHSSQRHRLQGHGR